MERLSLTKFRRQAPTIIRKVLKGKRFILTFRGKAVMCLEPIAQQQLDAEDFFYSLTDLAESGGESLTNEEIDQRLYNPARMRM
jgi:antitoxin (DNA-binding transcriptional repressor) of toxin-antitoxin stability system